MGGWFTSANSKSARRYPTPAQRRATIRVPLTPPHIGVALPHNGTRKTPAPARARPCSWCSAHIRPKPQPFPAPESYPTPLKPQPALSMASS